MAEAGIFELADLDMKADKEKERQAAEFSRLGVAPPKDANIDVFQQAAAELKKEGSAKSPETPQEQGGLIQSMLSFGKRSALPMLGGLAGGAGGAMLGGWGAIPGEMIGSGLGEKANQMLGITEPSKLDIGISTLAPGVGRALKPVAKGLATAAVKTFGTREFVSEAAGSLLNKWLGPRVPSSVLYRQAEELGQIIPASSTGDTIRNIVQSEIKRAPTEVRSDILTVINPLRKFFPDASKGVRGMSVADMMEESQRLRGMAAKAYEAGSEKLGLTIDRVRQAMLSDLESQGADVVREASTAYRKEMALERLGSLLSKPHPTSKIKDFAKNNSLFSGAFDETEKAQILRIARKLETVTPSGASGIVGQIATTAGGGELGGLGGAAAGYFTPKMIQALLATKFGRDMTEKLLAGSYQAGGPGYAALAMFARGMLGQVGTDQQQ